MTENLSFGADGFALIFDICFDAGTNSSFSFTRSFGTGLSGCGPTTVATGSAGFSSSEAEGLRFRERGGSGISGYRVENTLRRADQSGRTVRSSLRTGFSIYFCCGGDWLLVGESYWLLVRDLRFQGVLCVCCRAVRCQN